MSEGKLIEKLQQITKDFPQKYWIYCFECGWKFEGYVDGVKFCEICGFTFCPSCGACRCRLNSNEQYIVDMMWRTASPLVSWWRENHGKIVEISKGGMKK